MVRSHWSEEWGETGERDRREEKVRMEEEEDAGKKRTKRLKEKATYGGGAKTVGGGSKGDRRARLHDCEAGLIANKKNIRGDKRSFTVTPPSRNRTYQGDRDDEPIAARHGARKGRGWGSVSPSYI